MQDPFLRNLESRFALQQKIVEAAKKLANEPEICKTVKKKRRRNCLDAMHKLQQIEDEMNQYRVKKGKKPTQRASVLIAGMLQGDLCVTGLFFVLFFLFLIRVTSSLARRTRPFRL